MSSAATTATAVPTTAREIAAATPTASSASNRRFAEKNSNELVDVLISQSLSL